MVLLLALSSLGYTSAYLFVPGQDSTSSLEGLNNIFLRKYETEKNYTYTSLPLILVGENSKVHVMRYGEWNGTFEVSLDFYNVGCWETLLLLWFLSQ